MDGADGSRMLMGQRTGKDPFDGPAYIMQADGTGYARQKEIRLPRNTSVLSLAKGPVTTESGDEYVMINRFGRLVVTNDSALRNGKARKIRRYGPCLAPAPK